MQTDFRDDGDYVNLLNQYGTMRDSSSAHGFRPEGVVPDMALAEHYESNGLFAKIIDAPAEESIKHGFDLGLDGGDAETFIMEKLEGLGIEENLANAVRWARLFGGAIAVMRYCPAAKIKSKQKSKKIR